MRLSTKLVIISELVLVLLVFVLLVPVRQQMRQQVIEDMQNELRAIAVTAALQIDGDLHEQMVAEMNPNGDAFQELRNTIGRVMVANGLVPDNIYTFYMGDDDVLHFGVMTQDPFLGDPYDLKPHQAMSLTSGEPYTSELYYDDYGQWISAVAPIRNRAGEVVGLIEVNRRADAYFVRYDYVILLVTVIGLVGLAMSSLLGYFVLRHLIIKPVDAIHQGMVALGNGDFNHTVNVKTRDEFEELAQTLNSLFKQLNVARSIQANFFPKQLPDRPGFRFAARTDPCDATGGDYIDAFNIDDETIAILVADVTGHGLGPSLLMASCRSALHALARNGLEPAELVRQVEVQLESDLTNGRFITMIFGLLKPDGTFTYANAGHAPAMVVKQGRAVRLDSHRPPLGVFIDMAEPQQDTIKLEPGDRVVFTSDGVNEAQNDRNEQFGQDRIEQIIVNAHVDAVGVVRNLQSALDQHIGAAPVHDDITMLCVDRIAVAS